MEKADIQQYRALLQQASEILRDKRSKSGDRRRVTRTVLECAVKLVDTCEMLIDERECATAADREMVP